MFRKDLAKIELDKEPELSLFFERAKEVSEAFNIALNKILGKISPNNEAFLGKLFNYPFKDNSNFRGINLDPSVFLVLNPDLLLTALPPVLYHVTGESSARAIINGANLYPPKFHAQLDILPDKGSIAVETSLFLFEMFDISSFNYPSFLFSGAQIDSEQIDLQNNLPNSHTELHGKILNLFVEIDSKNRVIPKPWLFNHLTNIFSGVGFVIDEELSSKINKFLSEINQLLFLREGWYTKIKEVLFGNIQVEKKDISKLFDEYIHLFRNSEDLQNKIIGRSVVLEINTAKMIEDALLCFAGMNIFPFLVSPRPIGTIVPTPMISANSVQNIYYSGIGTPNYFDLPSSSYIGGTYPVGEIENYDPNSPMCAIRYQSETNWKNLFLSTEILPSMIYSEQAKVRIFRDRFGLSRVHHIIEVGGYGIFDTTPYDYKRLGSALSIRHSQDDLPNPNLNYIDASLRRVYPTIEGLFQILNVKHDNLSIT